LVVDEYGDIEGLVTVNDLLAAVVGASQLGHGDAAADAPIVERADGSWLIDGTLASMVTAALGHIPQTGEVFAWQGFRFEVVDLDGARIDKLLVTRAPQQD